MGERIQADTALDLCRRFAGKMPATPRVDATNLPLKRGVEQFVPPVAIGIPDGELPRATRDGDISVLVGAEPREGNSGYRKEEIGASRRDHVGRLHLGLVGLLFFGCFLRVV